MSRRRSDGHLATGTDIERLKFQLFAGMFAATGIIVAAIRLWA